jgi:thiamine kinase-like enzyme
VPFAHTLDLTSDTPALLCQQDVGDTCRPTSLDPITDDELRREAEGLAAIHAANLGHSGALGWLPRTDRAYFRDFVLNRCWRPYWKKALENRSFVEQFRRRIAAVEQAAESMVEEMAALAGEAYPLTLVHTDINPSNLLVHHGRPYIIDWQVPHYGTPYLDLPHHFCTLRQAEFYRRALADRGIRIAAADFAERYRAARRCIGFRYLWWTLEEWQPEPPRIAWVTHYLNLILR